ncbi:N-6 DNA methylase [Pedobacter borealis]|uniref:class I SAM-dependent DNA methyltransferase n=1 Tax=Pedobacter borealis TaxID=475254 RepID=UPI000493AB46|nr:N-6 DNA methylase [Pedobacter borealis]
MDLVGKLWNFCHTLRHEGVDYSDYIEELTYLLFLKIAEERGVAIPVGCRWNDLIIHDQEDLLIRYNEILSQLSREKNILGDIFIQPIAKIRYAASLKKLLLLIDEINWSDYNEDVLGAMFEGLLEKAANESKKGAGQYFTPRPLIEAIVEVMKPDPFESGDFNVSDIACGTSGFIISSYEWWKSKNAGHKLSASQKKKVYEQTYYGQELVIRPRRMAQMNLYLHGIIPNIRLGDTIYEPLDTQAYTCVLTNPPFGNKGASQIPDRKDFIVKTSNKQLNFIQHVFSCLKENGRAAIVLPDSVLTDDKAIELWKILFEKCNFHTILRLPQGTFLPYANVKAVVIFLQKGTATRNVWYFDARSNVESITKKDRPLATKHFSEFVKEYGADVNGNSRRQDSGEEGRFRKYSLDYIKKRNYNLDISWLKDDTDDAGYNGVTAEHLIRDTIDQVKDLVDDLRELLVMLEK